jgi:hypothetical protein
MTSFNRRVNRSLGRGAPDGYNLTICLDKLRSLNTTGQTGTDSDAYRLQVGVLATMVLAATDMHNLRPEDFKNQFSRAIDQLPNKIIRVALINRKRNDIAFPNDYQKVADKKMLVWHKTALTTTLIPNDHEPAVRYDYDVWERSVLSGIKYAISKGANIICLGEYDFPPSLEDSSSECEAFENKIIDIINQTQAPVLLFAGSSHCFDKKTSSYGGRTIHEWEATNRGRVFYNKPLIEGTYRHDKSNPFRVEKRTPAAKIGERLSQRENTNISTFKTMLGTVMVLICSDAYDPTIIFEIFSRSGIKRDRPDIIIVPSYNASPKFAPMCQLISLLTDSIVILLDVCTETIGADEKCCTAVWNCGWAPEDLNGLSELQTVAVPGVGEVSFCSIDWDKSQDFRGQNGLEKYLPVFSDVRRIVRPNPVDEVKA